MASPRGNLNSNGVKLHKLGNVLYLVLGTLIALAASAVLLFWDKDEMIEYWYYFLAGGIILYGLATWAIAGSVASYKNGTRKKTRNQVVGGVAIAAVLLGATVSGLSYAAWDIFMPEPFMMYPREHSIAFDPAFKFNTQYGNLNATIETLWATTLNSATPTSPDGYAWGESYVDRGLVTLYNSTGDVKYLYNLLNRTDTIINNSDRNNDGIPGYGTAGYTDGIYVEYIVWDGVVLLPLMQIANIIKRNASLWANASLQEKALAYANVSDTVIHKWTATHWHVDGNRGYFVSPPENKTAIFNRINALGMLMLQVHDFIENTTRKADLINQVTMIARFFKDHLVSRNYIMNGMNKHMYTWNYDANRLDGNSDTSHACLDVEFAIECHERGIVFDAVDMGRFANTFVDFVYRGRPNETAKIEIDKEYDPPRNVNHTNTFSDNVNGNTGNENYYMCLRDAWFKLYRYHDNVTLSSFVVARSLDDLVESMPTRPPYNTSISVTYLQCLSAIRHMAFVADEFPVDWF